MKLGLIEVKACPVCGGTERQAQDGMARNKSAGFHYLKHAALHLGISVAELGARARVHKCLTCGSYYCDPWLSAALASQLFSASAPDHIAGWGNFEEWLSNATPNRVEARNRSLYALLSKRIGPIRAYAEFGCPFQGWLLLMKGAELAPRERICSISKAFQREPDVRWSKVTRIYHAAEVWARRLAVAYLSIRARKESLRSKKTAPNPIQQPPHERVFLTEDTTLGWGSNCVRYGASCRYFTNQVLGATVLPLAEVSTDTGSRFDVIGIFNNLDHTTKPMDVLRRCVRLANHVLVVTHHASHAGRQHLYAFGAEFPIWLRSAINGVDVLDLSGEQGFKNLPQDYSYILISKHHEVSP